MQAMPGGNPFGPASNPFANLRFNVNGAVSLTALREKGAGDLGQAGSLNFTGLVFCCIDAGFSI